MKERLVALAGRHVTTDGVLLIVSRALRSQAQNREAAQARLVALLKRAAKPPKKRKSDEAGPGRAPGEADLEAAPKRRQTFSEQARRRVAGRRFVNPRLSR